MGTMEMSPYEKRAWEQIQRWRAGEVAQRRHIMPKSVRNASAKSIEVAQDAMQRGWDRVPNHDDIIAALFEAVNGLNDLVTDTALRTLKDAEVVKAFQERKHPVVMLRDIHNLDLEDVDQVVPDLRFRYSAGLACEGAAAGALAGGGSMFAGAGGIAGAGAGAVPGVAFTTGVILADLTAVLTATTRGAAHYASYYGYDLSEVSERAYLVGSMSVGLATGQAGKTRAFSQLHKVVGLLARDATWKQLNEHFFVRYVGSLYQRLGERLVKRKLGQALPAAGAAIGAGLNYQYATRVTTASYWLGRERFLMDKYALHEELDPDFVTDILDVEAVIEELQILSEQPAKEALPSKDRSANTGTAIELEGS